MICAGSGERNYKMNIQMIETFLALSEIRNFTKVAETLYVSQSTVTNRISDLEKELGYQLFQRNNRNVILTDAGKIYLDFAKKMMELHFASIACLYENGVEKKNYRVGTTNTIYESYLKDKIIDFMKNNDNCKIQIHIGHSDELVQLLENEELDYLYTYIPLKKAGYQSKCFAVDELLLVCRYDITEYENGICKDQLPKIRYLYCNFALQEVGNFIRELFPKYYQFGFEIDNSLKLADYIKAGLGYSFLPYSVIKEEIEKKQMRIIPLRDFESPRINNYFISKHAEDPLKICDGI